jgi:hypothetical protein
VVHRTRLFTLTLDTVAHHCQSPGAGPGCCCHRELVVNRRRGFALLAAQAGIAVDRCFFLLATIMVIDDVRDGDFNHDRVDHIDYISLDFTTSHQLIGTHRRRTATSLGRGAGGDMDMGMDAMGIDVTTRHTDEQLEQWRGFLQSYSQGGFRADQVPWSPPLPCSSSNGGAEQAFNFEEFDNAPVYERVEIDLETAGRVRDFYARYGFLPPPRGSKEPEREQCVEEYDLYSADQVSVIYRRRGRA